MPVVFRPHPLFSMLMRLRMLKLSVGKGRQAIKTAMPKSVAVLRYSGYRARGYVLYRALVVSVVGLGNF